MRVFSENDETNGKLQKDVNYCCFSLYFNCELKLVVVGVVVVVVVGVCGVGVITATTKS